MDAETRALIDKLRAPLPPCPFSKYAPPHELEEHDPCPVCGGLGTPDAENLCRGADTRIMDEAADALERIYPAGFEACREMMERWADGFEAETRALPLGHEVRSRGSSTYNWRMNHLKEFRAAIRSLHPQEPAR